MHELICTWQYIFLCIRVFLFAWFKIYT